MKSQSPSKEALVSLNRLERILNELRKIDPELPIQQACTLVAIAKEPGITVTEAGVKACVGLASVSRHIAALGKPRTTVAGKQVGLGMVATEYTLDQRKKTVVLTPKGERIISTLIDLVN